MIDTTSPHGKLIIAVLGALAEFERSMILSRTADAGQGHKLAALGLAESPSYPRSRSRKPYAVARLANYSRILVGVTG
jgi:DNA invertase Pin-like site-specific DNA recombinase